MKITIYGVGYVGLVTGACLADRGHQANKPHQLLAETTGIKTGTIA